MRTLGWIKAFCWRAVAKAAYAVGDGIIKFGDFAYLRCVKAPPRGRKP